jgi:hypothetical protein
MFDNTERNIMHVFLICSIGYILKKLGKQRILNNSKNIGILKDNVGAIITRKSQHTDGKLLK